MKTWLSHVWCTNNNTNTNDNVYGDVVVVNLFDSAVLKGLKRHFNKFTGETKNICKVLLYLSSLENYVQSLLIVINCQHSFFSKISLRNLA